MVLEGSWKVGLGMCRLALGGRCKRLETQELEELAWCRGVGLGMYRLALGGRCKRLETREQLLDNHLKQDPLNITALNS